MDVGEDFVGETQCGLGQAGLWEDRALGGQFAASKVRRAGRAINSFAINIFKICVVVPE